jgi:5-formyltetrahydrofolate cyclo-ligase
LDPELVKQWRRVERERLLALRSAVPAAQRQAWGTTIEGALHEVLRELPEGPLGVYWPFRAEFDPRPLIDWTIAAGRGIALPAVVDKKRPLEYRAWRPGDALVDGIWNIPVPEKREIVLPRAVLAPLVGFDRACYRLGYGGGYFDRTLAALEPRPFAIGVGFELSRLETIEPQPFDIPMQMIVTEAGVWRR